MPPADDHSPVKLAAMKLPAGVKEIEGTDLAGSLAAAAIEADIMPSAQLLAEMGACNGERFEAA